MELTSLTRKGFYLLRPWLDYYRSNMRVVKSVFRPLTSPLHKRLSSFLHCRPLYTVLDTHSSCLLHSKPQQKRTHGGMGRRFFIIILNTLLFAHFQACRRAFFEASRLVISEANVSPVHTRAMKKYSKSSLSTSKVLDGVT